MVRFPVKVLAPLRTTVPPGSPPLLPISTLRLPPEASVKTLLTVRVPPPPPRR